MNTLPEVETPTVKNKNNNKSVSENFNKSGLDLNNDSNRSSDLIEKESTSFLKSNIDIEEDIIIENNDLFLKFSSKGGLLVEAQLKNFVDYKGDPLFIINNGNQDISLDFSTLNGRSVNSSDYYFKPVVKNNSQGTSLTMVLSVSENQYINFEYRIPKSGYLIDFVIKSYGFKNVIDENKAIFFR